MKVIFLDLDGVLNSKRTPNPRNLPYVIDEHLAARFRDLVDRTGAQVVLSSTWRYDPAGLFTARRWGVPFFDVTPDLPDRPRRDEILAWLECHPETSRYVVLDDEDDELDELPLFQPSSAVGLTEEIAEGVADFLLGQSEVDMRCSGVVRLLQNLSSRLKGHAG